MTADEPLLRRTALLDLDAAPIRALIDRRGWRELPEAERIGVAYDFVRDEILFGYNRADDIPASAVLADGYGQCNTKGTLLMALLRALGIPCRLHGFTIHKALQRGVVPEAIYPITPAEIVHSWVEIPVGGGWINLEGFILDNGFLSKLQAAFPGQQSLCGYGAGTDCLASPPVEWLGGDTYIQKTGIARDFGVFETPDTFYAAHRQAFGPLKSWLYARVIRHWLNWRVGAIRAGRLRPVPLRASPHVE